MKPLLKLIFLLVITWGTCDLALARCVHTNSFKATIKVSKCEEQEPGKIFIEGELTEVLGINSKFSDVKPVPSKGKRYLFYKGLSRLVPTLNGGYKSRDIGYCREKRKQVSLKGVISYPCCDASYAFCERPVDFLIDG
jgi:hypothetical protein